MKKLALIFAALAFGAAAFAQGAQDADEATAKKWTSNALVGLSIPFSSYDVDGEGITQTAIAAQIAYLGCHRNGFTAKATSAVGVALTDGIAFNGNDDVQSGTYASVELGAGYSFIRTPKLTLSALGIVGMELSYYKTETEDYAHAELGATDRSFSALALSFTLGADITALYRLKEHFGLFANLGARWIPVGGFMNSVSYAKDDYTRTETYTDKISGKFSIVPTIGVVWNW